MWETRLYDFGGKLRATFVADNSFSALTGATALRSWYKSDFCRTETVHIEEKKHKDLIEKDEIIEWLSSKCCECDFKEKGGTCEGCLVEDVIDFLHNLPIVIESNEE